MGPLLLLLGFVGGVGGMYAYRVKRERPPRATFQQPRCACTIYLLRPGLRIVDALTGDRGFSHALVDCCEIDQLTGTPIVFDCQKYGLVRAAPDARLKDPDYWSAIVLQGVDGAHLYASLKARVGQTYNIGEVLYKLPGDALGVTCAQVISDALPARLQARVRSTSPEGAVGALNPQLITPNRLAQAFGIDRYGQTVTVQAPTEFYSNPRRL